MSAFYALQFTTIVILGLLIYYYGLRELRWFSVARGFLLLLIPVAVVLPLLYQAVIYEIPTATFAIGLDEIIIGLPSQTADSVAAQPTSFFSGWTAVLAILYLFGLVYSLAKLIHSSFALRRIERRAVFIQKEGRARVFSWRGDMPFTFRNNIFLPAALERNSQDYKMILRHEMNHVHYRHWMDKMWINFQCVLLWFFPPVYWLRSAISEVHELQADRSVVMNYPKKAYMLLLLRSSVNPKINRINLASPFISLSLKKRIKMIAGKTMKPLTSSVIVGLCLVLMGLVSLTGCKTPGIGDSAETTQAETHNELESPSPPPEPEAPQPPPEPESKEIFQVVEEMPRFPGCEEMEGTVQEKSNCAQKKMLQFIYENILYHEEARKQEISGMVVVSFIVNEVGGIEDAKVVRDIGSGLGDEALRVVNLMNEMEERWIPGRQRGRYVKVQINLPIRFSLSEKQD